MKGGDREESKEERKRAPGATGSRRGMAGGNERGFRHGEGDTPGGIQIERKNARRSPDRLAMVRKERNLLFYNNFFYFNRTVAVNSAYQVETLGQFTLNSSGEAVDYLRYNNFLYFGSRYCTGFGLGTFNLEELRETSIGLTHNVGYVLNYELVGTTSKRFGTFAGNRHLIAIDGVGAVGRRRGGYTKVYDQVVGLGCSQRVVERNNEGSRGVSDQNGIGHCRKTC